MLTNTKTEKIIILKSRNFLIALLICTLVPFSLFAQEEPQPFITVWQSDASGPFPGGINLDQIEILAEGEFNYEWVKVDSNDFSIEISDVNGSGTSDGTTTLINFGEVGYFRVTITPTGDEPFHRIWFEVGDLGGPDLNVDSNKAYNKLKRVEQWGDVVWSSFEKAFYKTEDFEITADDYPNLENVTNMKGAFQRSDITTIPNIQNWNVSNVTDMSYLFAGTENFNQNLVSWSDKVMSVTTMKGMFENAQEFNQDISKWNVDSVTDMSDMFGGADAFNTSLSDWAYKVQNVTDMSGMFAKSNYNESLANWNVSGVTDMSGMFNDSPFNQDISNWNVSSVTNMSGMFREAAFNQDISNWDVSSVVDMSQMFRESAFNQDIGNWDVSQVEDMSHIFTNSAFNHSLGTWNLSGLGQGVDKTITLSHSNIDCDNYSMSIYGWSSNPNSPDDIRVEAEFIEYSPDSDSTDARDFLESKGWTFDGDSEGTCEFFGPDYTDLQITKTIIEEAPHYYVGDTITFQLKVKNIEPNDANNVQVIDLLPDGYTYISDDPSNGIYNHEPEGIWEVGALAVGEEAVLEIVVSINPTGIYLNKAQVSSELADFNTINNTSDVNPEIIQVADLEITKTVNNPTPYVGDEVTFTIIVKNEEGPNTATGVIIEDLLPSGYSYVSHSGHGSYDSETGTWTINSINVGSQATLNIKADVNATGEYENTATIEGADQHDPDEDNNTASATTEPLWTADLEITKEVDEEEPHYGEDVVFTITVKNNGPSDAENVFVEDLLPEGFEFVSSNPEGTYVETTERWDIGELELNEEVTLEITATVLFVEEPGANPYTNIATVGIDDPDHEHDPILSNNTSNPVVITPQPTTDLAITKTVSNLNPMVGDTITFTITATNYGPSPAEGVKVTDLLPDGYNYVDDDSNGQYFSNTWNIGGLEVGEDESKVLNIEVKVLPTGEYTNIATIISGAENEKDPNEGNNEDSVTPVPTPVTDLAGTKTVDDDTPEVNSPVTFTLTVINNGPSDATDVIVTDLLENGFNYDDHSVISGPDGQSYDNLTGEWNVGNLADGESAKLEITAIVNPDGTNFENTVSVIGNVNEYDSDPTNNQETIEVFPEAVADLKIEKIVDNDTPYAGGQVTFTLTVINNGPSDATNVTVLDNIPSGYEFVEANGDGTWNDNTWTIGNLLHDESVSIDITVSVNPDGNYENTAEVSGEESDSNPDNNSDSASVTPVASADLKITKTVNNSTPTVGDNVVFTLTVTNLGPSDATNVSVEDLLPSGYNYISANSDENEYQNGIWIVGDITEGNSKSIQITAKVNADGDYMNIATVEGYEHDPVTDNNTAQVDTNPVASADLAITKTVSNSTPTVGDNIIFTITVTNNGPSDATGVIVTDELPDGYTHISDDSNGSYDPDSGEWNIGVMDNNAVETLDITVTVNADKDADDYNNTASVTGDQDDPDLSNNSRSRSTTPSASADLAVIKTVDEPEPLVGENVVFTITVTNNGPSKATDVKVTDPLPSGYDYVSDTGDGDYTGGIWSVGDLEDGESDTLEITATVKDSGTYTNTASVNGIQPDPNSGNNSSSVTPTPEASADLEIIKTVNNLNPTVGQNVIFTLSVTNYGPSTATDVSVDDMLPDGYNYISDTGGGAYNSNTGIWTIGTIAGGITKSIDITAEVNAEGNYTNTAIVVQGNEFDPEPENDTDQVSLTPVPAADLKITKSVDNSTPNVGEEVIFTLTVINQGPSDATGVTVTDDLPDGYTYVSDTGAGAYDGSIWFIGDLEDGESASLDITVTVNADGDYVNTASVDGNEFDPAENNNNDSASTGPEDSADLSITKSVSNSSPQAGQEIFFTLVVTNSGPSDATGVFVTDELPNGYTYISDNGSGAYDYPTGIWTIGDLADGDSTSLEITVTVNASGDYLNIAEVDGNEFDSNISNNTSEKSTSPSAAADLEVVKTVDNPTPNVGEEVVFTLTVTNNGPSDATNVYVTDNLPSGYDFVSDNGNGAYSEDTGIWNIGDLENGETAVLEITATVKSSGNYTNVANVAGTESDPTNSNNTSSISTDPVPLADLMITKSVNNSTPFVGENVTFTITVTNNGPSDATEVSVTEELPDGYTYVSDNGSGAYENGMWTIGNLSNGASKTLTITATVNASGNYENTVSVSGEETDLDPSNNIAYASTSPVDSADLAINKTVDNSSPNYGEQITFTLEVTNQGPSDATGVTVSDEIPSGYTYISDNGNGAYVNDTWTIGDLTAGASASLEITVSVNSSGNYTNTATVSRNEHDPEPDNNSSSRSTSSSASADLSIVKTVDNPNPSVGDEVVFTLTATNNGPSDAANVFVLDNLPSGYTYVSDNGNGAYENNIWTIGDLANGETAVLEITATVKASGNYTNTATISGDEPDPSSNNNSGTASVSPVALTDLVLTKTVDNDSPVVGQNVNFTLNVTNNGPSNATGVTVTDNLPDGYTYVSDSGNGAYSNASGEWNIGDLDNGDNASLTITVTVNASGDYTNEAEVEGTENESDYSNNQASATTTPVASVDLEMFKTVDNSTPDVGDQVSFTLTVVNNGPSDATGVEVEDTLPDGYTYISHSGTGTYDGSIWEIGELANGESEVLEISVTVNADGERLNTATVSSNEIDSDLSNNSAGATTDPSAATDLAVIKTVSNTEPLMGEEVTFTITVTNNGPSNATGVQVNDPLPSGYTQVSNNPSVGTYSAGTWTIGNLANGGTATLEIVASVKATGDYVNTATVTGLQNDPDASNNTASAGTTPIPALDLEVVKTINNNNPMIGEEVVFTISVTNHGPGNATGVKVTDALPDGYTYISDTGGGQYFSDVWNIGNLTSGNSVSMNIVASVNISGDYVNTATVAGNELDNDLTNNESSAGNTPQATSDLAIVKTSNYDTQMIGQEVIFSLTATNNGPSDATGVEVYDLLPDGYTLVQIFGDGTYENDIWTIGDLTNGESTTMHIQTILNGSGNLVNTAVVSGDQADPDLGNNESSATVVPIEATDLSIVKTVDNNTPLVGDTVIFTLTATNNGLIDATGVLVDDVLPNGYTLQSYSGDGSYENDIWTIGTLAAGETASLEISVMVNDSGNYLNLAEISSDLPDTDLSNNDSSASTTPIKNTDLSVVKTVDNPTPLVGENVVFTITVTNDGPSNASGVKVTDAIPSGYTYIEDTANGQYFNNVWNIGNLSNGSSVSMDITAVVNPSGDYLNTAVVTGNQLDPDESNNESSVETTPGATADLAVVKSVSNLTPLVGEEVTFTITVTNNGPSNATDVLVNEVLNDGFEYISDNSGGTYDGSVWTVGDLAVGENTSLEILVQVKEGGDYTNTVSVEGNETDLISENNESSITLSPDAATDLEITKTVNETQPYAGDNVVFTLSVTNNGPSTATGVTVSDQLPSGYTYVSDDGNGAYQNNVWTIGTLNHGETAELQITAKVNASGNYTNTASVSGNEFDTDTTNNSDEAVVAPLASTDLAITKTVSNLSPYVGQNIQFTITVTNNGPSNATGVTVTDVLPDGYSYISDNGNGVYENDVWTIGNLENEALQTLIITVEVLDNGDYLNTASVTGNEFDSDLDNNEASASTDPESSADLNITKSVDNATPLVGEEVTFTLTATNNGPSNATGVFVTDVLPTGYTYIGDNGNGTYENDVWTIGDMALGDTASLEITVEVNADGDFVNIASVEGNEHDPNTGNNQDSAATGPEDAANLKITKTVDNAEPLVGEEITFTLTALNRGPSDATGVIVTDNLPDGYTYVSDNGNGAYENGVWTIGDLAVDEEVYLEITVSVNAEGEYLNTAEISGNEFDTNPSNNTDSVSTTPEASADLSVTKTVDNQTPLVGEEVVFTITVTNNGLSDATGVSVTDQIPSGYTYLSDNGNSAYENGIWTIGDLAYGANASLEITVLVNAQGNYDNTAIVSGNETDVNEGNNQSTQSVSPTPVADLSISKTIDNDEALVGDNVVFTISVTNNGPSDATGVNVTDNLPDGYTYVSDNGNGAYENGIWTIGDLADGESISLEITAEVNASGDYLNTAEVSGNEFDSDESNNQSSAETQAQGVTDLSVIKTVDNQTPLAGEQVVFSITVHNDGPSDATDVEVTEILPDGYTYISDDGNGSYDGTIWTVGDLGAGENAALEITVSVNASGDYLNTVTVSGTETDLNPDNNESSVSTTPIPATDLSITKTVDNPNPLVGEEVTFTLTVTNNGPSSATGVQVTDVLPSGYTYVSDNSDGSYSNDVWVIGNLTNQASVSLDIVVSVNTDGDYVNTASVTGLQTDTNLDNNESSATINAEDSADLAIIKTVDVSEPLVGDSVVFTLTVTNNGPSDATGVEVTDQLPDGYTYVSDDAEGDYDNGIWTIGDLENGETIILNITATVNPNGDYLNIAMVSGDQTDTITDNNESSVSTQPEQTADLSITKTVDEETPYVGEEVIFTLIVTNHGPSDATGVTVTDALPDGYTFISDTGSGSYDGNTWTIGNLEADESISLEITAQVNNQGNYTNTANVTGAQTDTVSANNQSSASTTPVPVADLEIVKTVDNTQPLEGDEVIFTITVTNHGPSNATGVQVAENLPDGYTYISHEGDGNYSNGTWTIGNLANGVTATLEITVSINAEGEFLNNASVSGLQTDLNMDNNESSAETFPEASADLSITKTVDNNAPLAGEEVVFTLTVTNNGPSAATGVTVTDELPSGYTYVSDNSGGAYDGTTWDIGDLANGESASIEITVTVNPTGFYLNTASVSGNEIDVNTGNNTASVSTGPEDSADLGITKTVDNETPDVGEEVTFTLTLTNYGPSEATDVNVVDILPDGYTYVSDSGNGAYDDGVWTIDIMESGTSEILEITVVVNSEGDYVNHASVSSNEEDVNPDNNQDSAGTVPNQITDLAITKTVDNMTPDVGDLITFTLTATNFGPNNATGVTVTDILPAGYTYQSDNGNGAYDGTIWDIGNLDVDETVALEILVQVNSTEDYLNTAEITGNEFDNNLYNNQASVEPDPVKYVDLGISKTVNPLTAYPGETVTFTLAVINFGPNDATGVKVNDLLPDGYTYISDTSNGAYSNGLWTIGDLAEDESVEIQITAEVNGEGEYLNIAVVSGDQPDPKPSNDESSAIVIVPGNTADLAIEKTVSEDVAIPGQEVVFTLTVTNHGPDHAGEVSVTDVLPSGYTYVSDTGNGAYQDDMWTIGILENGESVELQITVVVNEEGEHLNTATVTAAQEDPDLSNNTDSAEVTPIVATDLAIVKTVDNFNPFIGDEVTFTLTVTNHGPVSATNVWVVDLLPSGYTYVSDTGNGAYENNVWSIGDLEVGAVVQLQITAIVNESGDYLNIAETGGDQADPDLTNNTDSASVNPVVCDKEEFYISYFEAEGKNNLQNSSGYDSDYELEGYGDYTHLKLKAEVGTQIPITIKSDGNNPETNYYYQIKLDSNRNGGFDMVLVASGSVTGGNWTGNLSIPDYVKSGVYTFRVELLLGSSFCEEMGEREDYTIEITGGKKSKDKDEEEALFENFNFYPNPVVDILNLKSNVRVEEISIYDLRGRRVVRKKPNSLEPVVNMDYLAPGVYFMNVTIGDYTKVFRLVKR